MSKLKPINFIGKLDKSNYLLIDCIMAGFGYIQTSDMLKSIGYYIPEDQFISYKRVLDIQIDLDIGTRRNELNV